MKTSGASQQAIVLFAFLAGPVGVLAPKGMVVLVVAVGVIGLVRWAEEGFPLPSRHYPLIGIIAASVMWAAISASWSFDPSRALILVGRLVGIIVTGAGLVLAVAKLEPTIRSKSETAFLTGMVIALVIMTTGFVYAKVTGDSLWGTHYFDPLTTLNNGAVAISLLAWPTMAVAWRRYGTKAVLVAGVAYFGLLFLSSGTALLAPVMGLIGFSIVWFLGKRGVLTIAAIAAVLILLAPQAVTYGLSEEKLEGIITDLPPSARHRLAMWPFAVEKIDEKPFLGWGMDASRFVPQSDRRLLHNMEIMPLHPHNAFLQVRLELGIPGAVLAALLVGWFFARIRNVHDRFSGALMAGTGGAYLTVASLSYGVWQNWWVAFAWALAALTSLALKSSLQEG